MSKLLVFFLLASQIFSPTKIKNYTLSLRSASIQTRQQVLKYLESHLEDLDKIRRWPVPEDSKKATEIWEKLRSSNSFVQSLSLCLRFKPIRKRAFSCLAFLKIPSSISPLYRAILQSSRGEETLLTFLFRYEEEASPYLVTLLLRKKWKNPDPIFQHLVHYPHPKAMPLLKFFILKRIGKPKKVQKVILSHCRKFGFKMLIEWIHGKNHLLRLTGLLLLGRSKTKEALELLKTEWRKRKKEEKNQDNSFLIQRAVILQAIGETGLGDSFLIHLLSKSSTLSKPLKEAAIFGLAFGNSPEGESFLKDLCNKEWLQKEKSFYGPLALQALAMRNSKSQMGLAIMGLQIPGKWREKSLFYLYRMGNLMGEKGFQALIDLFLKVKTPQEKREILSAMRGVSFKEKRDFLLKQFAPSLEPSLQQMIVDQLMTYKGPKIQEFMFDLAQNPKNDLYLKGWIYLRSYNQALLIKALFQNLESKDDWFALESAKQILEYPLDGVELSEKQKKRLLILARQYPEEEALLFLLGYFRIMPSFSLLKDVVEKKESGIAQKTTALQSLGRLSSPQSRSFLIHFIQSSKGHLHYRGIGALGLDKSPKVLTHLQKYFHSQDPMEKRAALMALFKHPQSNKEALLQEILPHISSHAWEAGLIKKWLFDQGRKGRKWALYILKHNNGGEFLALSYFFRFGTPQDLKILRQLPSSPEQGQIIAYLTFLKESQWNPALEKDPLAFWFSKIHNNFPSSNHASKLFYPYLFLWHERIFVSTEKWLKTKKSYLKTLNIKGFYRTTLREFKKILFLSSTKDYPSVLTGKEWVVFHPQKGVFFIFKKDKETWKLWGGG
ncbi:MAG: HEAT repeat domain-containing protein [Planctomycetota bacterium]|nr:MAG: HEAT repeat domain-containing protein [Planctomycetota bacterium]